MPLRTGGSSPTCCATSGASKASSSRTGARSTTVSPRWPPASTWRCPRRRAPRTRSCSPRSRTAPSTRRRCEHPLSASSNWRARQRPLRAATIALPSHSLPVTRARRSRRKRPNAPPSSSATSPASCHCGRMRRWPSWAASPRLLVSRAAAVPASTRRNRPRPWSPRWPPRTAVSSPLPRGMRTME